MRTQKIFTKPIGSAVLELTCRVDDIEAESKIRFLMTRREEEPENILYLYERMYKQTMTMEEVEKEADDFLEEYFNFKVADMTEQ